MTPILKEDFIKDFFEYFPQDDEDFNTSLEELEDDDFLELDILDVKEKVDVQPYESFVKFRAIINDKYKLDSTLIIYNTSSIFALIMCGYEFEDDEEFDEK